MSKYIVPYITEFEYMCPCCGAYPPSFKEKDIGVPFQMLFDAFELIRNEWGRPIRIGGLTGGGGYRCPKYNSMVQGTYLSAHLFGLALDLDFNDADEVLEIDDFIESELPDLRRGTYTDAGSWIHIDVGYYIYPKASSRWREGARWTG